MAVLLLKVSGLTNYVQHIRILWSLRKEEGGDGTRNVEEGRMGLKDMVG